MFRLTFLETEDFVTNDMFLSQFLKLRTCILPIICNKFDNGGPHAASRPQILHTWKQI